MGNIVSLSGGKDSTAMLHMMIDRGEKIDAVVFFDTGWEFPEMHRHIDLIEKNIGINIIRLKPRLPFEYIMLNKPIRNKETGKIHRHGNGWPSPTTRWCTREKVSQIEYFKKAYDNPVGCVGFAHDEKHRVKDNTKTVIRYPLIEWGITEKEALDYCFKLGYQWGGLYEHFSRVSCYCCPLKKIGDLRKLRKFYPELWDKMLEMDSLIPQHNKRYRGYKTVIDIDKRFLMEDKQQNLFY